MSKMLKGLHITSLYDSATNNDEKHNLRVVLCVGLSNFGVELTRFYGVVGSRPKIDNSSNRKILVLNLLPTSKLKKICENNYGFFWW